MYARKALSAARHARSLAFAAERLPKPNAAKQARQTGRKGCAIAYYDPGRSCPPHTTCARAAVCRREAAAYHQGKKALALGYEGPCPYAPGPLATHWNLGAART